MCDKEKGACSTEENITASLRRRKQYNVSHPPLFPMIPLTNVVIDNLHLFLRMSDVLISQLIIELKRQDSIVSATTFRSADLQRYWHFNGF